MDTDPWHGEADHEVLLRADRREPANRACSGLNRPKCGSRLRANKKCVSLPVSASYGFEDATGEVKLKIADDDNKRIEPNTVTVMIDRGDLPEDGGSLPARCHHRRGTGGSLDESMSPFRCEDEPCLTLDRKAASVFAGKVVRKDLVRKVKVGANVPVFVLEYLLGKYCATDDPAAIDAGLKVVNNTLSSNFVRPDEANKAQSMVKDKGKHTLIDKVQVRYLSDDDKYWAELKNFGHKYVHIPEALSCGTTTAC